MARRCVTWAVMVGTERLDRGTSKEIVVDVVGTTRQPEKEERRRVCAEWWRRREE